MEHSTAIKNNTTVRPWIDCIYIMTKDKQKQTKKQAQ